jgi:hypothetical protein
MGAQWKRSRYASAMNVRQTDKRANRQAATKRSQSYLLQEGAGNHLAGQKTVRRHQDPAALIKDRSRESDPLSTSGVTLADSSRVHGEAGHDDTGGKRLGNKRSVDSPRDRCPSGKAHQAGCDDDRGVTRGVTSAHVDIDQGEPGSHNRTPMHSRDGAGEDNGATKTLPPRICPGASEDEEEGQGDGTRGGGNDDGPNDEGGDVSTLVVADGGVAEVVHAADGASGQDARDADAPPADAGVGGAGPGDDEESNEQHDDRDEEGSNGDANIVSDLNIGLSIKHRGCAVANVMLLGRDERSEGFSLFWTYLMLARS